MLGSLPYATAVAKAIANRPQSQLPTCTSSNNNNKKIYILLKKAHYGVWFQLDPFLDSFLLFFKRTSASTSKQQAKISD